MADPRRVRRAVVHKQGAEAAMLTRTPEGVRFEYLPDYDGPEVATTLPLDAPPVISHAGAVPPFFAGLLPEGRRLTALRQAVKTSADDELSLLLAVGADTIGDVTVLAEGQEPAAPTPLIVGSDFRFADLLSQYVVDRVGLPGVQEKASGAMVSLPVRLRGSSAIVKLEPPEYPGVTRNEGYFLSLARRLKIPVAKAELIHDAEGVPGLVVERFDRVEVDGQPCSLAVEDTCQLLAHYPADKYNLSSEEVSQAVIAVSPAALVAARACLIQFAFAWLTGNGDLHGKNLSVLQQPNGEWRVAPVYDVPSTLPYGDQSMALSMTGRRQGLSRKRFKEFGGDLGLGERAVDRTLDDVLAATSPLLDDVSAGALPLNANATRTLVRQLGRRRRDLEG